MAADLKVLPLVRAADPDIVNELERLLALAKSGELTAYAIFYHVPGGPEMSNVGFSEAEVVFTAEVMKERVIKRYR